MQNLNDAPPFDVIIVLGAAQKKNGEPGPAMERRVVHAARYMQTIDGSMLLLSGGCSSSDVPEATTMKQLALSMAVMESRILCETASRTTLENAANCADLLRENRFRTCVLVTDSFHMRRAVITFHALGVAVRPEPVFVPWTALTLVSYCREFIALLVYPARIRNYLKSRPERTSTI